MKAIRKYNTLGMDKQEWLSKREEGIGGSEVSSVLGLNKYQSSLELFYKKVEGDTVDNIVSAAMFMGNYLEDKVAELYSYWETDMDKTMENYLNGKQINKVQRINAILANPEYPYLLGNVDRKQSSPEPAILEIKIVSGFALDTWEFGIPPMYIAQCQAYMLITGYKVAKLVILKDGRYLEVFSIESNEQFQSHIVERCEEFWQRVLEARSLKAEGKPFEHLEPEPDSSEAYETFLKAKFRCKPITLGGTMELYTTAQRYVECKEKEKAIKDEKQTYRNILMNALREAERVDFGLRGYISWAENKNGVRAFNVKLKPVQQVKGVAV